MTPTEEHALKLTMDFGGYVTTEHLAKWRPDIAYRNHAYVIQNLVGDRLLLAREEHRVGKAPIIYQVTRKACLHFGRPDSYLRRKRTRPIVHRALLKGGFLFDLIGKGYPEEEILCYSDTRIEFFLSQGINERVLPAKYNYGTRVTQIEEHILLRSPFNKEREVTILYTDKPGRSAWEQVHTLFESYMLLSQQVSCPPLSMLIICEQKNEEIAYSRALEHTKMPHNFSIQATTVNHSYFPQ